MYLSEHAALSLETRNLFLELAKAIIALSYESWRTAVACCVLVRCSLSSVLLVTAQTYYNDPLEPVLRGAAATRQGLLDITTFHYLTANMRPLDKLLAEGHTPETVTLALQLASNNAAKATALIQVSLSLHKTVF